MEEQKRTFSRVATRIAAHGRKIPSSNARPLFAETRTLMQCGDEQSLAKTNLPEPLIDFLVGLNSKLDALIGMLNKNQILADFPLEIEIVEISGAGMRFTCDEPLAVDGYLEIVLILSQYPLEMAGAVGKIIRSEKTDGQTVWAMDFTNIRERDQEAIVRFVFQEEREMLRKQRWS